MAIVMLKRCWIMLSLSLVIIGIPSCKNESDFGIPAVPTEAQMSAMVDKVANSGAYQSLFLEMAKMSVQIKEKHLIVKKINLVEFTSQMKSSRTMEALEVNLARGFSDPKLVISFGERVNSLFTQLDAETHFSTLSNDKRVELLSRAVSHPVATKAFSTAFKSYNSQFNSGARLDCGGNCNTVYWHTIESAAANMALAAGGAWVLGLFGGPMGMMAGAGGIAIAGGAYLIAEHYALVALGDCFDTCVQ